MHRVPHALVDAAATLADTVLFPGALAVDESSLLPVERLDALAAAGLYGLGVADCTAAEAFTVVELVSSGDLTTSFVWQQHHSAVRAVAAAGGPLARRRLEALATGEQRAGVAFAHLRRPGPPMLRAERIPGGWRLTGSAPWLTGWDRIDVVHMAARTADDHVVWALVDATTSDHLTVTALELAALAASGTVRADVHALEVADDDVTAVVPWRVWERQDHLGLRVNGANALGVAGRCAGLLGDGPWRHEVDDARAALHAAPPDAVAEERAACSVLAVHLATAVVAEAAGAGMQLDRHPQRLHREAMFCLVQGQTAAIRTATLRLLAPAGERSVTPVV